MNDAMSSIGDLKVRVEADMIEDLMLYCILTFYGNPTASVLK